MPNHLLVFNYILIFLTSATLKSRAFFENPFDSRNVDSVHSDEQTSTCSAFDNGLLLTGIKDIRSSSHYTVDLNINITASLIDEERYIYCVALDCFTGNITETRGHLNHIARTSETFLNSRMFWDREELLAQINGVLAKRGSFSCILGGKSTGKTFLLKQLKNNKAHRVVFVDLRESPNLFDGLITALELADNHSLIRFFKKYFGPKIELSGKMKSMEIKASNVFKFLSPVEKTDYLLMLLKHVVDEFDDIPLSIVIDEADQAFRIDDHTSAEEIKRTKEVLSMFVSLTKTNFKVNIILASSDHSFPYRLGDPRLNFNLVDIRMYIYTVDISPKNMFALLTEEWGVHEKLAVALISMYGGHILNLADALRKAITTNTPRYVLHAELYECVYRCLSWDGNKKLMRKTLQTLAEKGFYPIHSRNDTVAEIISLYNVGGVVINEGINTGIPEEFWRKHRYGLVPAGQSIRLVIASILSEEMS